MPQNYTAEARDKFPLPPRPDELDYSTKRELKVAEDAYSAARDRIAAERDRWVEREKVRDLEREEAIRRAELERKRKEEEEQAERLEAAARKKANAVAQALLAGRKGCDLCLRLGKFVVLPIVVVVQMCSDFVEYECSRAEEGPGSACASCRKSKKKCEWSSEPLPGPSQAGPSNTAAAKVPSSKTTAAPTTPTTSKSVVVEIPTQHRSRPSVEAMREIAAEIRGLREAYDERLDQEAARMKRDEQRFLQEESRFQQVESRTKGLERQQLAIMDAIQRLTSALIGDFQAALAHRGGGGGSEGDLDLEPDDGGAVSDGDMEVED